MRRVAFVLGLLFATGIACEDPPVEDRERIAAEADLTTRQLIAGLNAKNREVLSTLLVVTSTTGGPPRALNASELASVLYPEGPFEYVGAGKPGSMLLRDGSSAKQSIRLVKVGEKMKVLATSSPLAGVQGVRIYQFMQRE
jgi:hypothetical protein